MQTDKPGPHLARWMLAAAILAVAVAAYFLLYRPGNPEPITRTPPSTEWTVAPESPGVEVNLPKTRMTNVPAEQASPAKVQ
jgi:hypothetical protein